MTCALPSCNTDIKAGKYCGHKHANEHIAQRRKSNVAEVELLSFDGKGETQQLDFGSNIDIRTEAELLAVMNVDTTVWEVVQIKGGKWSNVMKPPATTVWVEGKKGRKVPMWVRDSAKPLRTPLYRIEVTLKRKSQLISIKEQIEQLVEESRKRFPQRPRQAPTSAGDGTLLEISISDLHVGKLAWGAETDYGNYDSKIAEQRHDEAIERLLARTGHHNFERILLVIGNDLMHSDNKAGTTTKGTQLDNDGRYHKTFLRVSQMTIRTIERLRQIAPVTVLIVPGNHDTLSIWHLGHALDLLYTGKAEDVEIRNEPTPRKYYQHGVNMLMFAHGNKGKLRDYPQLMAREQPQMWANTKFREAHTGDKHTEREYRQSDWRTTGDEFYGVKVRIIPALCEPDAWHSEEFYVGNQLVAQAFVWHREQGLVNIAYYTASSK